MLSFKKIFIFFLFQFSFFTSKSQVNLVPNPSFESYTMCPNDVSQIDFSTGWFSSRNSPDYYNSCFTTGANNMGVPTNVLGNQFASTGNAYAGIFTYSGSDYREYLGTTLSQTMIPGQKYFISFRISFAEGDDNVYKIWSASNKFGALFSTFKYNAITNPAPINNVAHFYSNDIITDRTNWTLISGSFISDSAYKYMSVGNFFTNSNTDTSSNSFAVPGFDYSSYYYVDDICVSIDSLKCNSQIGILEHSLEQFVNVYPNPVTDYIEILNYDNSFEIVIFNSIGDVLYEKENVLEKKIRIDANSFESGLLIIYIKSQKLSSYYKFIKK